MSYPKVVSQDEWLAARKELLAEEKAMARGARRAQRQRARAAHGRGREAIRVRRAGGQREPARPVRRPPPARGPTLHVRSGVGRRVPELYRGLRRALRRVARAPAARDANLAVISTAPLAKIERYKAKRDWKFPWYSSFGSDFNYDFNVTIDASVAPVLWNYRTLDELEAVGMGWLGDGSSEQPGYSIFLRDSDAIVSHLLDVHAGYRDVGRLVLLPRHDHARPPGGVGGTEKDTRPNHVRPGPTFRLTTTAADL